MSQLPVMHGRSRSARPQKQQLVMVRLLQDGKACSISSLNLGPFGAIHQISPTGAWTLFQLAPSCLKAHMRSGNVEQASTWDMADAHGVSNPIAQIERDVPLVAAAAAALDEGAAGVMAELAEEMREAGAAFETDLPVESAADAPNTARHAPSIAVEPLDSPQCL